jgi:hypothetical protein
VSINVWKLAGDALNISCNFLCCNHQVNRDFLIILYIRLHEDGSTDSKLEMGQVLASMFVHTDTKLAKIFFNSDLFVNIYDTGLWESISQPGVYTICLILAIA